jgi:hypothetical protein
MHTMAVSKLIFLGTQFSGGRRYIGLSGDQIGQAGTGIAVFHSNLHTGRIFHEGIGTFVH